MNLLKENIRAETDITVELIEMKKKELLKKLVRNINRNKMEELVLALRIIDYVQEETLVRKETFEKLSKEKLLSNILVKMDELAWVFNRVMIDLLFYVVNQHLISTIIS